MGIKYWNVYKRSGSAACVGDKVRYRERIWRVIGTQGSDSNGVPYVRLRPMENAGGDSPATVGLLTDVERVR